MRTHEICSAHSDLAGSPSSNAEPVWVPDIQVSSTIPRLHLHFFGTELHLFFAKLHKVISGSYLVFGDFVWSFNCDKKP